MPRTANLKEWVGKTDNSMPPPSVRLRIFRNHDGKCHITGNKIQPTDEWDLDHIRELADGGENRESNMAPALRKPHRKKSAKAKNDRARMDAAAKRHYGIKKPSSQWGYGKFKKKMSGEVVLRDE